MQRCVRNCPGRLRPHSSCGEFHGNSGGLPESQTGRSCIKKRDTGDFWEMTLSPAFLHRNGLCKNRFHPTYLRRMWQPVWLFPVPALSEVGAQHSDAVTSHLQDTEPELWVFTWRRWSRCGVRCPWCQHKVPGPQPQRHRLSCMCVRVRVCVLVRRLAGPCPRQNIFNSVLILTCNI